VKEEKNDTWNLEEMSTREITTRPKVRVFKRSISLFIKLKNRNRKETRLEFSVSYIPKYTVSAHATPLLFDTVYKWDEKWRRGALEHPWALANATEARDRLFNYFIAAKLRRS